MRFIDFESFVPSDAWKKKAEKATEALLKKSTLQEQLDYIDAHSQVWRDLRPELLTRFGSRCWFTDAEETVAQLDIEHFRPKAKALDEDESCHEGYWWLAFQLSNLRLAGQIPNRQYKKCYFPLLPGSQRANSSNRRWQEENPVFLDPAKLTDVELVGYDESGSMCPSLAAETDEEKMRVEVTNRLFGLSVHEPLVEARRRTWSDCRGIIDEIVRLKAEEREFGAVTARTKAEREQLMRRLRGKVHPDAPFSSVAKSCLLMSGHGWAITIATS
jgi:hypothetical protein